jgi:hypothetical protein
MLQPAHFNVSASELLHHTELNIEELGMDQCKNCTYQRIDLRQLFKQLKAALVARRFREGSRWKGYGVRWLDK